MNNQQVFYNPNQTQTLTMLQLMLYIRAVLLLVTVLFGGLGILTLLFLVLSGAGGYGIANEKKWGYYCAVGFAVLNALFYAYALAATNFEFTFVIGALFAIVYVVLTFHTESREYVRIWFK